MRFIQLYIPETDPTDDDPLLGFAFFAVGFLFIVFTILLRGFQKNIKILFKIRKSDFDLDIEGYEMDHAVHFLRDLPMKKEDVEKLKKSLSFENIIEMLEFAHIIKLKGNHYIISTVFYCDF